MSAQGSGGATDGSIGYLDYFVSIASSLASYMRLPVLASSVGPLRPPITNHVNADSLSVGHCGDSELLAIF
jgi:hypothetical protein